MAEPLKNRFGPDVPVRIAGMLAAVDPRFPVEAFVADALVGYDELELTARGRLVAGALSRHLPPRFPEAADVVEASLGPVAPVDGGEGMASFIYLPHGYWVAEAGLEHPGRALALQHALTQRFTAEFSIRAYLERHPELTLRTLREWTGDPSAHVRRLVSEGTRPRLPWAPRLRAFMRDPTPVLALLELLRDDPEPYVRRSVANNLNDIGKDHPGLLLDVAARWMAGAGPDRRRLVRHALRSLTRAGDADAMAILGVGDAAVRVDQLVVDPAEPVIGGAVRVSCRVTNDGPGPSAVIVHLRVDFVRANGGTAPRTFIMGEAVLGPGRSRHFRKTVSVAQQSTRTHHPGRHDLRVVVNGTPHGRAAFALHAA